jgi:hypothetical protein
MLHFQGNCSLLACIKLPRLPFLKITVLGIIVFNFLLKFSFFTKSKIVCLSHSFAFLIKDMGLRGEA